MKKILIICVISISILCLSACSSKTPTVSYVVEPTPTEPIMTTEYTSQCVCKSTDNIDTVFVDSNGEAWLWGNEAGESHVIGVKYNLTMDNNNTPNNIYDDIIISIE